MFIFYLVITLIFQIVLFRLLWEQLLKELMDFENRIDEKISLYDKLNRLENDREK